MSVENPWAFVLIWVPLLAFLDVKRVQRHVAVPSLLYFRDLPSRRRLPNFSFRNDPWRWATAVLLALAIGVAIGPVLPFGDQLTVLVLDDSARMQAIRSDGHRRFEIAKAELHRFGAERLTAGDEVQVVPLSMRLPAKSVTSSDALAAALEAITPQLAGRSVEAVLPLIFNWAAAQSAARVAVATDRPLASAVDGVKWIDAADGEDGGNVGIVEVRSPTKLFGGVDTTTIVVRNFGKAAATGIEVKAGEEGSVIARLDIEPDGSASVDVDVLAARKGLSPPYRVSLHHPGDRFELDDDVWILPNSRRPFNVLFPCGKPGALWQWLLPHPAIHASSGQGKARPAIERSAWDLVVYDGCTAERPSAEPDSHMIMIDPSPNADHFQKVTWQAPWYHSQLLSDIKPLKDMAMRAPRNVALPRVGRPGNDTVNGLFGYSFAVMEDDRGGSVLGETAFTAVVNGWKIVYLAFDPHYPCDAQISNGGTFRQDDCLSMTWLMWNAFNWIYGEAASPYYPTGALFVGRGKGQEWLTAEAGQEIAKLGGDGTTGRYLLSRPGLYEYSSGTRHQKVSVALLDAEESSLSRRPVAVASTMEHSRQARMGVPAWRHILWLCVLAFLVEAALLLFQPVRAWLARTDQGKEAT